MEQGNVYISCNYSCTISFLAKILLIKYFYIQYAWISVKKKQKSNQNGKVEKMVVLVKKEFNHDFTNHGYLHSPIWKALYSFKIKRAQEASHNQFFFQNVQINEIFEIFKMFKNMFKVKFEIKTNSNMQSSIVVSILSVLDWK